MDILGNFYFNPLLDLVPTSSTSTTSSSDEEVMLLASNNPKRRGGRKKLRETRHPVYRGVRWRNSEKWISDVRVPGKKSRIWLGTVPTAEMAARAHDVAVITVKGRSACLNFADSAWRFSLPASAAAKDIQKAAAEAAEAFRPSESSEGENSEEVTIDDQVIQDVVDSTWRLPISAPADARYIQKAAAEAFRPSESSEGENSEEVIIDDQVITQLVVDSTCRLSIPASVAANVIQKVVATEAFRPSESSEGENSNVLFMDEEALFYMPGLLANMAEGLMLPPPPPPQCIDGYGMEPHHIDMSLWSY